MTNEFSLQQIPFVYESYSILKISENMIAASEVVPIGQILKTHGIEGELSFLLHGGEFDFEDIPFLIFEMDGILVPFFLEEWRFKTEDSGFLKLEDVNDEKKARKFSGLTIYLHKKFFNLPETEIFEKNYFVGFQVFDKNEKLIGTITTVDESTENTLFVLNDGGKEILIPVSEEYILNIDENEKIIRMDLPEGLLEL